MFEFFIDGVPQPQGSKTGYVVNGRAVIVDKNPKLLKPWRKQIADKAPVLMLEGAVEIVAEFYIPRPKSVKRDLPYVRPDLDKYARALLDGLTGKCFKDDSQVTRLVVSKVYGTPAGVQVRIGNVEGS